MTSTKTDSTSSSTSLCPSHHTAHKLQPSLSPPSISTSTIDPPISNEDVGSETSNDDPHVVMKRRRELSPSTPPISHPAREVILDDIGDEHEVVLETSEVCEENAIALDSRRAQNEMIPELVDLPCSSTSHYSNQLVSSSTSSSSSPTHTLRYDLTPRRISTPSLVSHPVNERRPIRGINPVQSSPEIFENPKPDLTSRKSGGQREGTCKRSWEEYDESSNPTLMPLPQFWRTSRIRGALAKQDKGNETEKEILVPRQTYTSPSPTHQDHHPAPNPTSVIGDQNPRKRKVKWSLPPDSETSPQPVEGPLSPPLCEYNMTASPKPSRLNDKPAIPKSQNPSPYPHRSTIPHPEMISQERTPMSRTHTSAQGLNGIFGSNHPFRPKLRIGTSEMANEQERLIRITAEGMYRDMRHPSIRSRLNLDGIGGGGGWRGVPSMMIQHNGSVSDNSPTGSSISKGSRRRVDDEQLCVLMQAFNSSPYPTTEEREVLGRRLGMTSRSVQIWFQNRRRAMKVDQQSAIQKAEAMAYGSTSAVHSNPYKRSLAPIHMRPESSYRPQPQEQSLAPSQTFHPASHPYHSQSIFRSMKREPSVGSPRRHRFDSEGRSSVSASMGKGAYGEHDRVSPNPKLEVTRKVPVSDSRSEFGGSPRESVVKRVI